MRSYPASTFNGRNHEIVKKRQGYIVVIRFDLHEGCKWIFIDNTIRYEFCIIYNTIKRFSNSLQVLIIKSFPVSKLSNISTVV